MKAKLHYFFKLKGTQNKENEDIKYSSPIPFCPTYLLWAMKIFGYKLQLFYLKFYWSSSKESLVTFTCPSKILWYEMFHEFLPRFVCLQQLCIQPNPFCWVMALDGTSCKRMPDFQFFFSVKVLMTWNFFCLFRLIGVFQIRNTWFKHLASSLCTFFCALKVQLGGWSAKC